nr:non-ribosomal peptide synthetase [Kibdelosporangium sp. MJ126-NF4]CEL17994.1 iron aquisition yersiniabactin synthesis enzyme (Irp2) [Kibdelosporangium sp. MJ126-NF4]CTQ90778.1 iron aquisition yersiniabactin synthesis enzyme (Irp2) [Kibdelosporangium sp. MJ126-NF4]
MIVRLGTGREERLRGRCAARDISVAAAMAATFAAVVARWSKGPRITLRLPTGEIEIDTAAHDLITTARHLHAVLESTAFPFTLDASIDGPTGSSPVTVVISETEVRWDLDDLGHAYDQLLNLLADNPSEWDHGVAPLPQWQSELCGTVNDTADEVPDTLLHTVVEQAGARDLDHLAIITTSRRLTYRELLSRARRIGRRLRDLGAAPGTLVAVYLDKGWEQAVAILGVLQSGAAWVPIDPALPAERREHLLRTSEAVAVLGHSANAATVEWLNGLPVLAVDKDEEWAAYDDSPLAPVQGPDDLAYVIFTSGSTGLPKGGMVHHRAALNTVLHVNTKFGIEPGCRFISLSAMSFDLSVWDVFGALCAGATLVVPDAGSGRNPAHWVDLVRAERVTTWMGAPALFEMFCEVVERDQDPSADSLRLVILGGDWIPLSLPARAKAIAPDVRFVSLGGNTEASILSCTHEVHDVDPEWTSIPYGKPLPNQTLHVLDHRLDPKPVWVPGELYIGGTGVAQGYWRDPERTAAVFLTHPHTGERLYRTGDQARRLPDGTVEFLGRTDFQVKVRGHRIELGEIESALRTHPSVGSAVAIGVPYEDRPGYRGLAAFVVPTAGARPSPDELREHLRTKIPGYMVPAKLVTLDSLPLTANGKVDRRALAVEGPVDGPVEDDAPDAFVAPRTALERQIGALWSDVLGVGRIGVHDDFFSIGGHSLLGIRVMNRLRSALRLEVDLHIIFETRTVAALALRIDQLRARDDGSGHGYTELPPVVPAEHAAHDPFPLTDQQQAYALGRTGSFSSGNVSAHAYFEYEGEDLDLDRFRKAWQRVVDRHPMLRAVVDPVTMTQRVLADPPPYEMSVVDLRGQDPEAASADLRARLSHEVRPIDTWPLYSVAAARLDERRTRVFFSIDALFSDFASMRLMFADLQRFYRDPDLVLPPVGLSYRDYVSAAASVTATKRHQVALAYWTKRLADLPPAPDLPMVRDPKTVTDPKFVRRTVRLSAQQWQRLTHRAGTNGLTASGLVLAAYTQVLGRWTTSPRFTVNVTNFNRLPLHPDVSEVVGEFASFSLLEVDTRGREPFAISARRLQEQLWNDLSHTEVTGVQLLRELMRQHGGFHGAMMPVVFTSTIPLAGGESTLLDGLLRPVYGITQTPQVWMDLLVDVQDGELVANWDVVEVLFPDGLVDEMFIALGSLLSRLADDEHAWMDPDLDVTTTAYRFGVGDRRPIPPRSAHRMFVDQVAQCPDRVAVIARDRILTYAELHEHARRVAGWLRDAGAGPGKLVAILMEKGWEQAVAAYAVLYTGAAYVPIDPEFPAERVDHVLELADVEIVLTQQRLAKDWPDLRVLCVDGPDTPAQPCDPVPDAPDDLAYVLFTSGSTGQPKGVMIEHRGLVNCLAETVDAFGIGPGDRCLALTALHHDMSVFDLFGALGAGATLVMPDAAGRRDASQWAELVRTHSVTVWNSVPAMMDMLLEHIGHNADAISSLRLAFLGGDWIPLTVVRTLGELAPATEVVSVGGPTETTLWNIWHRVGELDPAWRSVPYGTPIANTRYHILDESMMDRPVWATGQMFCSGVGVARGYWRDPERTAAVFTTHPRTGERIYATGDLGRFRPDGTIEFVGRADFQVQIGGHRIELGEVEAALATHPAVRACVVTGQPHTDRPGYRALIAYVVPTGEHGPDLREYLTARIPGHMVPAYFVSLDALPLTANGKVDRRALPDVTPGDPGTDGRQPRTALEEVLMTVWQEVLGADLIGTGDNFFSMGGDSLAATRIITRLRRVFDSDITLQDLLGAPSVAAMARSMSLRASEPGRLEKVAHIHLEVERMSAADVDAALAARGVAEETRR